MVRVVVGLIGGVFVSIRGRNVVENLSNERTIDVALIVDQSIRLRCALE